MSILKKLGLVTIGQTPRIDLVLEIKAILGNDTEIVEKGALDGLTLKEVETLCPIEGDEVLVTRMIDGTEVKVAERYIYPRLKNQIKALEKDGIKIIFLACTGEFPSFDTGSLIIKPQKVLFHVVKSIAEGLTLGILIPDELQVTSAQERWSEAADKVIVAHGSPYSGIENIEIAAKILAKSGIDLIVMDCIGYTLNMKDIVSKIVEKPVILARSMVAKVVNELMSVAYK